MIEPALVRIYKEQLGRIVATLIRVLGDFALAEEIAHDAFAAALEQWPADGAPANPAAWLVQTAKHKAVDEVRRHALGRRKLDEAKIIADVEASFAPEPEEESGVPDDRLRLIHVLSSGDRRRSANCVDAADARRIDDRRNRSSVLGAASHDGAAPRSRKKQDPMRENPLSRAPADEIGERLESVMTVVYLVFTEGYAATAGDSLIRRDLCTEAIRVGQLLAQLMPNTSEVEGLCALMLLHDSRRDARVDTSGNVVLLEQQDRSNGMKTLSSRASHAPNEP